MVLDEKKVFLSCLWSLYSSWFLVCPRQSLYFREANLYT
jgi:hypothetical protein